MCAHCPAARLARRFPIRIIIDRRASRRRLERKVPSAVLFFYSKCYVTPRHDVVPTLPCVAAVPCGVSHVTSDRSYTTKRSCHTSPQSDTRRSTRRVSLSRERPPPSLTRKTETKLHTRLLLPRKMLLLSSYTSFSRSVPHTGTVALKSQESSSFLPSAPRLVPPCRKSAQLKRAPTSCPTVLTVAGAMLSPPTPPRKK